MFYIRFPSSSICAASSAFRDAARTSFRAIINASARIASMQTELIIRRDLERFDDPLVRSELHPQYGSAWNMCNQLESSSSSVNRPIVCPFLRVEIILRSYKKD